MIERYFFDLKYLLRRDEINQVPKQRGQMQWTAEGGFSSSDANKIPVNTDVKNINWEVNIMIRF